MNYPPIPAVSPGPSPIRFTGESACTNPVLATLKPGSRAALKITRVSNSSIASGTIESIEPYQQAPYDVFGGRTVQSLIDRREIQTDELDVVKFRADNGLEMILPYGTMTNREGKKICFNSLDPQHTPSSISKVPPVLQFTLTPTAQVKQKLSEQPDLLVLQDLRLKLLAAEGANKNLTDRLARANEKLEAATLKVEKAEERAVAAEMLLIAPKPRRKSLPASERAALQAQIASLEQQVRAAAEEKTTLLARAAEAERKLRQAQEGLSQSGVGQPPAQTVVLTPDRIF